MTKLTNNTVEFDSLDRFTFDNTHVRGEVVRLQQSYADILASYHYPEPIQQLIGELMAATCLLTATLKFKGEIALQLQSDGPVSYIVVNGTHDQKLRGVARWDEELTELPTNFTDMFTKGLLAITITPLEGERYQGIVALDKPSLGECLEAYFLQSEQLLTKVLLYTTLNGNVPFAAGLLLQVLPESSETSQGQENNDFDHLSQLAKTLREDEMFSLPTSELLFRLYHQDEVRVYEPQHVKFECSCSKERSAMALQNVNVDELMSVIKEQGSVKMNCQFCHVEYQFDEMDIKAIHSGNIESLTHHTAH